MLDYLVRRASELVLGDGLIVDVGCGDGRLVVELDRRFPGRVRGFDLPAKRDAVRARVRGTALEQRFHEVFAFAPASSRLPFRPKSASLVVTNQVVEHVVELEPFLAGCRELIAPRGAMLCVFPPLTHLVEAHTRVPLLHWVPPGRARQTYLRLTDRWAGVPCRRGSERIPEFWDRWLQNETFYRTEGEFLRAARSHFDAIEDDAEAYLRSWPLGGVLSRLPGATRAVQTLHNCTFVMRAPRHAKSSKARPRAAAHSSAREAEHEARVSLAVRAQRVVRHEEVGG